VIITIYDMKEYGKDHVIHRAIRTINAFQNNWHLQSEATAAIDGKAKWSCKMKPKSLISSQSHDAKKN